MVFVHAARSFKMSQVSWTRKIRKCTIKKKINYCLQFGNKHLKSPCRSSCPEWYPACPSVGRWGTCSCGRACRCSCWLKGTSSQLEQNRFKKGKTKKIWQEKIKWKRRNETINVSRHKTLKMTNFFFFAYWPICGLAYKCSV